MRRLAAGLGWLAPALAALAIACDSGPVEPEVQQIELPRPLTSDESELIAANNRFGIELLRAVVADAAPDETVFMSPISASMALGMTLNGADATTFDQMRSVLGFGEMARGDVNEAYRTLMELLLDLDPRVTVSLANALWLREGFEARPEFVTALRDFFGAAVESLDFSDPSAAEVMNAWVRTETEGKIDGIVDPPIDPLTRLFLMNAVFFEGDWTYQFDPERTAPAPFFGESQQSTVQMMSRSGALSFGSRPDYDIVELPYGGQAFVMTILIPRSVDIGTFLAGLDPYEWDAALGTLAAGEAGIELPRFRLEDSRSLNQPLIDLGMVDAFDEARADFSLINPRERLFVKKVKQKAFVEVDEEGTTAAAVTSVEIGPTSVPPSFRVDRPFVFAIRERLSGTLLFAGAVRDLPDA